MDKQLFSEKTLYGDTDTCHTLVIVDWDKVLFPQLDIADRWKIPDEQILKQELSLTSTQQEELGEWSSALYEFLHSMLSMCEVCTLLTKQRSAPKKSWILRCIAACAPQCKPLFSHDEFEDESRGQLKHRSSWRAGVEDGQDEFLEVVRREIQEFCESHDTSDYKNIVYIGTDKIDGTALSDLSDGVRERTHVKAFALKHSVMKEKKSHFEDVQRHLHGSLNYKCSFIIDLRNCQADLMLESPSSDDLADVQNSSEPSLRTWSNEVGPLRVRTRARRARTSSSPQKIDFLEPTTSSALRQSRDQPDLFRSDSGTTDSSRWPFVCESVEIRGEDHRSIAAAVDHLIDRLGGQASFIIAYSPSAEGLVSVVGELKRPGSKCADAVVFGCTTCMGTFINNRFSDRSTGSLFGVSDPLGIYSTAAVSLTDEAWRGRTAWRNAAAKATQEALESSGIALPHPEEPLVLLHATPGAEEAVIAGINEVLPKARVFGGSAADSESKSDCWRVVSNSQCLGAPAVSVALMWPSVPYSMKLHCLHSCPETRDDRYLGTVQTSDDRRIIMKMNSEEAREVYRRWCQEKGASITECANGCPDTRTTLMPLARCMVDELTGATHYFPLHPQTERNPDGSLSVFADAEDGEELTILSSTREGLIDNTVQAAAKAKESKEVRDQGVSGALVVYCAGVALELARDKSTTRLEEVASRLHEALRAPVIGCVTFGEQGPLISSDKSCHANLMFNLLVFGRRSASRPASPYPPSSQSRRSRKAQQGGSVNEPPVNYHLLSPSRSERAGSVCSKAGSAVSIRKGSHDIATIEVHEMVEDPAVRNDAEMLDTQPGREGKARGKTIRRGGMWKRGKNRKPQEEQKAAGDLGNTEGSTMTEKEPVVPPGNFGAMPAHMLGAAAGLPMFPLNNQMLLPATLAMMGSNPVNDAFAVGSPPPPVDVSARRTSLDSNSDIFIDVTSPHCLWPPTEYSWGFNDQNQSKSMAAHEYHCGR